MLIVKTPLFFITFLVFLSPLSNIKAQELLPNQKVNFYKSPKSQFPSGEASLSDLKRTMAFDAQSIIKAEYEYFRYGQQKLSKKLISPTFAKDLSLIADYSDIGRFLVLKETSLKKAPHLSSATLAKVSAQSLLVPLKYEKGFIQVIHQGKKGFVDISFCISKFDFAVAIYAPHPQTKNKQWHYVKSRTFDQIGLHDGTQISMAAVEGIFVNEKIGIVTESTSHLPLWSKVSLEKDVNYKTSSQKWIKSTLKGHGLVWWKEPKAPQATEATIDQLLKKEVYSISSHPKEPKKSIVSTEGGVFITSNGENWKQISQFKNYKGPVYYYNDNLIFVGSYRSTDQGKSFDRFINVNSISDVVAKQIGYKPQSLKIKRIKSKEPLKISLDIDTGYRIIHLQSKIYDQNWEIVRN